MKAKRNRCCWNAIISESAILFMCVGNGSKNQDKELVLAPVDHGVIFPISGFTIGYVRDLSHGNNIDVGLGTQFTVDCGQDSLDRYYGDDLGYAFQFFLRIRPSQHTHGEHNHTEHVAGTEK